MGRGLIAPAGGAVRTVATDDDGRYLIERLATLPSWRSRVVSVTLVIYQRGYVAYRCDRVFDNPGGMRARTDFSQHNNVAKLDRWTSALSHVKHVRFVGGSGALKRALGSELVEASLELTSGPRAGDGRRRARGRAARRVDPALRSTSCAPSPATRATFTVEKLADLPTTPATTAATSAPPARPRPSTPRCASGS